MRSGKRLESILKRDQRVRRNKKLKDDKFWRFKYKPRVGDQIINFNFIWREAQTTKKIKKKMPE